MDTASDLKHMTVSMNYMGQDNNDEDRAGLLRHLTLKMIFFITQPFFFNQEVVVKREINHAPEQYEILKNQCIEMSDQWRHYINKFDPKTVTIKYKNSEGKLIEITNDQELRDAYDTVLKSREDPKLLQLDLMVFRERRPWLLLSTAGLALALKYTLGIPWPSFARNPALKGVAGTIAGQQVKTSLVQRAVKNAVGKTFFV